MFNIGLFELLVILFFLILFIKPEEIPKVTKNLGLFYRKINRYIFNLKYELDEIDVISNNSKASKKRIKKKNKNDK